ncbi:MAG: sugar dehydrogenase [Rhodospirillales bacterium 20-64-7]|nr:MAG: sugar dehydrogenase [Rhodospirillales bacterium 20-64-7]
MSDSAGPARFAQRFAGRRALVTGGSRGIGRAIAERLAAEGATVVFSHLRDHDAAAAALASLARISADGGYRDIRHRAEDADVTDTAAMDAVFARATAEPLHLLVNNAGIQTEQRPSDQLDLAAFERVIAVNLTALAACAGRAIRHFLQIGGGVIVNISSVHEIVPKPGYLSYSAAKGGVGNITRTLALEYAGRGIRVNAVGPGATVTDMNVSWTGDPVRRAAVNAHIPMARPAEPSEIAAAAAFLASDDASYVTGQTLQVCGGLSLYGDFAQNWAS